MTRTAKRWIVGPDDGPSVADVVARAGGDPRAIADGRVFVGRIRARDGAAPVRAGDVVEIAPPVSEVADVALLAAADDLVAVSKPAGIPTIPDHGGAAHALIAHAARLAGVPVARLHATSRLDREVSGVVIFALSPDAAARLKRAREEGTYARRYVAIAARAPEPARGAWDAPIGRAKDPRLRAANGRDSAPARTLYASIASVSTGESLLALAPITGRTHQIRVHASHAGAPLLGDRAYGGPPRITLATGRVIALARIALHCARVSVPGLAVEAPLPPELSETWSALGGDPPAWDTACACALESPASS